MSGVCVDYLDVYRKFFDNFALTVDHRDQLPVKVAAYNLVEEEIAGAVADWALQYLEQRRCPTPLVAHLVHRVVEEVKQQCKLNPVSCGFSEECSAFLPLRLMQTCIAKLVEVCARYENNAELSSFPMPHPLPPTASCAIKNSRRTMEDRHVVIHDFHALFNIKDHGPASYYGVFDGHNGVDAAVYSVSHLHQFLAESQHYPSQPVLAMRDACIRTDQLFASKAKRENLHGGTTAVYALLRPKEQKLYVGWLGDSMAMLNLHGGTTAVYALLRPKEQKLYVGWLGDSMAMLVRRGVPHQIVTPHKPDRSDERMRIEQLGGTILFWGAWRVNGQLALSRAIGDIEYKPFVCAVPDVEEITLDGTEDFLVLGCDGLWDFVSEEEVTNAVYTQLHENPEDLEGVSSRLVTLAKEQSSQDNISVVVVFLAEPAEVARRRLMEAAVPSSPFVNGADSFCGGPTNGQHPALDDIEDFGPETDVDMVDDVLLSPAIAAAKALVQSKQDVEDDLELQRRQMSDFDDPADLGPGRDTPTPPAHAVASNANSENLAESGGEESEEEWNYFPGKENIDPKQQDPEDMSSQLNPNAAEFVPVSPTRLLMMDDAIISASPSVGFEKSMDDVTLPSELEFASEISHRPGDLDIQNGPKHVDYFMRDNFSTLRKDFNVSSTCAVFGDDSVRSLSSDLECLGTSASENVPFDKLDAVQNIEEKVSSAILDNESLFPTSDISNSAYGTINIFDKNDPMMTSTTDFKVFSSPEPEDNYVPGTPKSTVVEAPVSPVDHQTELDSPADDYLINAQKSPDLISPGDGPQDNLILGQERTSSSGFESESGPEEGEMHVPDDNNEGFITEHRRSPPIDLSFKPIQTFSDNNPFGALQTPSASTPFDQFNLNTEVMTEHTEPTTETPIKDEVVEKSDADKLDFLQNTPSSFISLRRSVSETNQVPFDELNSPIESPDFVPILNTSSTPFTSELPKTPEPIFEDKLAPTNQEPLALDLSEDTNPEYEETSFTNEDVQVKEPNLDLDTAEESKILNDEQECEKISKLTENFKDDFGEHALSAGIEDVSPKAVEQVLAAFDDIKDDPEIEIKSHESDFEQETKEMKLEFESHIANSSNSSDELKNIVESFEVIHKDELAFEDNILNTQSETKEEPIRIGESEQIDITEVQFSQESTDILSPSMQTNPFMIDDTPAASDNTVEWKIEVAKVETPPVDKNLISEIEGFNAALIEDSTTAEKTQLLSSPVEPQVTKTVTYQMLTPADEPKLTKSELYVTGAKEEVQDTTSSLHVEETPRDEESLVATFEVETEVAKEPVTEVASELEVAQPEAEVEQTVAEVAQPEAEVAQLETEVAQPEAEVAQSEAEVAQPEAELAQPEAELAQPEAEAAQPKAEVAQPEAEAAQPEAEVAQPEAEVAQLEVKVAQTETEVALPEAEVAQPEAEVAQPEEPVVVKNEPVYSQVVTETLITALEETSEVPSVTGTEAPGTPPPTPAPGLDDTKDDIQKTDVLVAAVAAAGAVAAGAAIVSDQKSKKAAVPAKKPAVSASKTQPSAPKAKSSAPSKAPATKTTTKPLGSTTKTASAPAAAAKPPGTAGKPASPAVAPKSVPVKAPAVPAKKPSTTAPVKPTTAPAKPTTAPAKPTTTAPAKPTTTAPAKPITTASTKPAAAKPATAAPTKQVPNKLPVNKTTAPQALKSTSKPTTPTSKPTTPTTPKSPSVIKSPPRSMATTKPVGATKLSGEKSADKKPLANGEVKSLTKKDEVVKKTTAKPSLTARPATAPTAPAAKTSTATTRASQPKTAAVTSVPLKTKPSSTTTVAAAKRPSTTPASKVGEKVSKEAANKQISLTKPAVNGKAAPPKSATAAKKTDAKVNGKVPPSKPSPIKKMDEVVKEEEKQLQIQEDNVTTTNGFAEHIMIEEHESLKIEALAPVVVDGVN